MISEIMEAHILSEGNLDHSKYVFDETGSHQQTVQENIVSECLQTVLALNSDLENVEKSSNSDNEKTGSAAPGNFKATDEYQKQEMDTGADENKTCINNDMNVSHTESGYLTDSHISKDCDSVPDRHDSNHYENDRTLCGENLMTYSSSSSNTSIKANLNECSVAKSITDFSNVIGNDQTPSDYQNPFQTEVVDESEVVLSQSLPHGQIIGSNMGMIEFIANDLQEKIRSSSISKTVSSDLSSHHSSILSLTSVDSIVSSSMATSMTSGISRSFPQSPDCVPPIDPSAIHDIENQARLVADGLDHLMGNLRNNLFRMLAISVGCDEAYRTSVDITCDSMDASIKSMMALIAKCEELSNTMEPVYKLADQIKEIKRLLDRFENQLLEKQS